MAKRNQPGKGVKSLRLDERVKEAADELFEVCDGVVIVCVKFSGAHDNDEQIVRALRGPSLAVFKGIDMMNDYDDSRIKVVSTEELSDEEEDD